MRIPLFTCLHYFKMLLFPEGLIRNVLKAVHSERSTNETKGG